jgi:ATPase subunit of ABC transporter with duplicated ATPase domains
MFPAGWDQEMITQKLGDANIPEADLMKKMSDLSHGQRMKIRFLQLMLHSYDLLVLDEPTNHLDIATREELEVMLQQYEGAMLIVSHDRWFVQQIGVQTKWRIRDEKTEVLPWKKKYSDKGK